VTIVKRLDPKLARVLAREGMEPHYALSWVLTWFAHDLTSLSQVSPPRPHPSNKPLLDLEEPFPDLTAPRGGLKGPSLTAKEPNSRAKRALVIWQKSRMVEPKEP
jgi:hypothetical protein